MQDAVAAVAGPFAAIPTKIRQTLYALFGLVVIVDAIWGILPADSNAKLLATWGVFNSVMALGNSIQPKSPPPVDDGGVEPQFPDEFA